MNNARRLVWFALGFVLGGILAGKAYAVVFDPERYWEAAKELAKLAAYRGCAEVGNPLTDCLAVGDIVYRELEF